MNNETQLQAVTRSASQTYCVDLASSDSSSNLTRMRNIRFTDKEVRELRYAALLHDFGKVGVRESVRVEEKKLTTGSLENILYPI
ncbi:MAG: hypothetical protein P8N94_14880 [Gammaproteobacteria bacterium]|nr:hypothetical protein [Gammaproteobacteria bacterium]MDG2339245.1 hypothetical protein [Gammaproteobacteria bacterium]